MSPDKETDNAIFVLKQRVADAEALIAKLLSTPFDDIFDVEKTTDLRMMVRDYELKYGKTLV